MAQTRASLIRKMLDILRADRSRHLLRIDRYIMGDHDGPYIPDQADDEYRLLARRCITNWMPLLIAAPSEALYVDGFRRGSSTKGTDTRLVSSMEPEWDHWQHSRLDARQVPIHRAAVGYGHSFTITAREKDGKSATRGLSPLRTSALFEDPANDVDPYAAIHVDTWEGEDHSKTVSGRFWDGTHTCQWEERQGEGGTTTIVTSRPVRHGNSVCPVTRFAAQVDLEGRTIGVVEPMIQPQDRINQTVFDLLVTQTGGAFKVRWASGMAPPLKLGPDGKPVIDPDTGRPIPLPVNLNVKKFLFNTDPEGRFGTLDETSLEGYIKSVEMSIRHIAAISQTPPHHLLGQIANLSAEALEAAEVGLARKVEEYRKVFGESWERVFQLSAELDLGSADYAWDGEVIWRDLGTHSLGRDADGLGKLAELLHIPRKGLWRRVPGVTQGELSLWEDLREQELEEDPERVLAAALTPSGTPTPTRDRE